MNEKVITLEEQVREGWRPQPSSTHYVPATVRREAPPMPINSNVALTIDAPPTSTMHTDVRTSEVDRAKGFLLRSVPLYGAFALLVLLVTIFFYNVPFLSLPALVIFWLSFVMAWLLAYCYDLSHSPAGIAHYESRMKWRIIEREHDRRWAHYDKLAEQQEGE